MCGIAHTRDGQKISNGDIVTISINILQVAASK